eukprot:jgi/Botrbrau1/3490/Bobra.341_2s0020.1
MAPETPSCLILLSKAGEAVMAASMLFKSLPIRHSFAHYVRKLSGKLACLAQGSLWGQPGRRRSSNFPISIKLIQFSSHALTG